MQEVGQLEDLGRDGGQTVAVEPENLQAARQVGEAAALQRRDAVVVQEPAGGSGQGLKHVEIEMMIVTTLGNGGTHRFLRGRAGKELALISTMLLLLRSSVSMAMKAPSCSAKILVILLFALKTQTPSLQ